MNMLNIPEPYFITLIKTNKIMTFIALIYLNSLGSSMLASGAFEIYLNGEIIFSKLESKVFPDGININPFFLFFFFIIDLLLALSSGHSDSRARSERYSVYWAVEKHLE